MHGIGRGMRSAQRRRQSFSCHRNQKSSGCGALICMVLKIATDQETGRWAPTGRGRGTHSWRGFGGGAAGRESCRRRSFLHFLVHPQCTESRAPSPRDQRFECRAVDSVRECVVSVFNINNSTTANLTAEQIEQRWHLTHDNFGIDRHHPHPSPPTFPHLTFATPPHLCITLSTTAIPCLCGNADDDDDDGEVCLALCGGLRSALQRNG